MKKLIARASLTAVSAVGLMAIGMSGTAAAASVHVSTMGPNSGVNVSTGGGWGESSWGGHGEAHNNWNNEWHESQDMSQCRGANHDWTHYKKSRCNKSSWKQACAKAWDSCWTRVRKACD